MITTALTDFVSFLMPGQTKVFPTAQAAEA
jgi:hypothetical protein